MAPALSPPGCVLPGRQLLGAARIGGRGACRASAVTSRRVGGACAGSGSGSGAGAGAGTGARRREVLLGGLAPLLLASPLPALAITGTSDPTTVVNSVLSAYGLPSFKPARGFTTYDDFGEEFVMSYPRAWVARSNTQRDGLYLANYKTADKATVEVLEGRGRGEGERELLERVLLAFVAPGQQTGGDSRLLLPSLDRVAVEPREVGGVVYTDLAFTSDVTTRSGYNVKRKNYATFAERGGKVYAINASARSDQYDADKAEVLQQIVGSFRVRRERALPRPPPPDADVEGGGKGAGQVDELLGTDDIVGAIRSFAS